MSLPRALQGKVVLITGAGGGLGQALARRCAQRGAMLGLMDLGQRLSKDRTDSNADGLSERTAKVPPKSLLDLATELRGDGAQVELACCDVCDAAEVRLAVEDLVERLGGVDLLINNAGLTQRSAFLDTDISVYRKVMEVNFFGSLHCTKAAMPHLLERRGQVLVISSVAGFAPLLGRTGYCASKHALHGLFDTLRAELAPQGVGVLIVSPSFIQTPINVNALAGDGAQTQHPQSTVGKLMLPEQAARSIVFAAEHDRRFLVLGKVAVATRLLVKLWPRLYERLMIRSVGSELQP